MKLNAKVLLAAAALVCLVPASALAITYYIENFEELDIASTTALGDAGWLVFGNVFDGVTSDYMYGYGVFPAPNNPAAPAFCTIVAGQGGVEQGDQQLSVFSDYENADHGNGHLIESNVFREYTIGVADVGKTWTFSYQAKAGDLAAPSTAIAFIKTLDPLAGYATTNFITQDMTVTPTEWGGWSLELAIDVSLVGQLFQIGFSSTASNYVASSVIYDNIFLTDGVASVPDASAMAGAELRQNYPNPFNPMTRIEFSLEKQSPVSLAVYDTAGRLVTTLVDGALGSGDHQVTWNGRTAEGGTAAAGQYHYVLRTDAGQVSRSMILLK